MVQVEGPYDLEAVRREWIGRQTEKIPGRYPVEFDSIRRHCHMVEDRNPLFLDPQYGRASVHGSVIAPPVMTRYFASAGVWPPAAPDAGANLTRDVPTRGVRMINLNTEWEYLQPAKVGDQLSSQTEVKDIYEKSIRLDPRAVWIVTEMRITNQAGELVAVGTNTLCTHRTPEQVEAEEGERPNAS